MDVITVSWRLYVRRDTDVEGVYHRQTHVQRAPRVGDWMFVGFTSSGIRRAEIEYVIWDGTGMSSCDVDVELVLDVDERDLQLIDDWHLDHNPLGAADDEDDDRAPVLEGAAEGLLRSLIAEAYTDIETEDSGAFVGFEEGILAGVMRVGTALDLVPEGLFEQWWKRSETHHYGGNRPLGRIVAEVEEVEVEEVEVEEVEVEDVEAHRPAKRGPYVGRARARTIDCPRCGVEAGDFCVEPDRARATSHQERVAKLLVRDRQSAPPA